jgi:WD40 repeat protein
LSGRAIKGFDLGERIAVGGFGAVYRAVQVQDQTHCSPFAHRRGISVGTGRTQRLQPGWPNPGYLREGYTARLWDVATGAEIRRFDGHTGAVLAANFSPNGQTIVVSSFDPATERFDRIVRLWDVATGAETYRLAGPTAGVTFATFSPDGRSIVTTKRKPRQHRPAVGCHSPRVRAAAWKLTAARFGRQMSARTRRTHRYWWR